MHGDKFAFVAPANRLAADDVADEGLVPDKGTRGPRKWSKQRHGHIVAQQVGDMEV